MTLSRRRPLRALAAACVASALYAAPASVLSDEHTHSHTQIRTARLPSADQIRRVARERDAAEDRALQSVEKAAAAAARRRQLEAEQAALSEQLARLGPRVVAREAALETARRDLDLLRRDIAVAQARHLSHRKALTRILSRLQRAAREPTPSLVIQPGRPIAAARGAMLLARLAASARAESGKSREQLERAARSTRLARETEIRALRDLTQLRAEEAQLQSLLERKKNARKSARELAHDADDRARTMTQQALSLSDLAAELAAQRLAAEARRAAEALRERAPEPAAKPVDKPPAPPAAPSGAMLAEAFGPFDKHRRPIVAPVAGRAIRGDGYRHHGLYYASPPYARVVAPWSGVVLYAGQFQSEGKIVIIEPQKGFQVVLVGLYSVDVGEGDRVSAGEPIGRMGGPPPSSAEFLFEASAATSTRRESLFLEIRRRGQPIDPAAWMDNGTLEVSGL